MGRTTEEKKGKTVIVRISEELHEKLLRKSEEENISLSEYAREILRGNRGRNTENDDIKILKEENCVLQKEIEQLKAEKKTLEDRNVIQNPIEKNPIDMDAEKYKDLERMCKVSGLSVGRFMESVYELFSNGEIYLDGLSVRAKGKYDIRELEDICHRVNADPQDMINRLTKSLLRG